jgi:formylglycine-generating enzyme required for sulfatase activity
MRTDIAICVACSLAVCVMMRSWVGRADASSSPDPASLPLVRVPDGEYRPTLASVADLTAIPVRAFRLMTRPVRNDEFLRFVIAHASYRRDRIPRALADAGYLADWAGSVQLGSAARPHQPVTRVSWFAARAFCEARGLRLPTEAEWELAAAASETERDARSDPAFRQRILDWYAQPARERPDVPSGPKNLYGLYALHGVIWEWVEDFNNRVVDADSRSQGDSPSDRFVCGGGALSARDALDYPAFLRLGFRGSLQAVYTATSLGFRCAADAPPITRRHGS